MIDILLCYIGRSDWSAVDRDESWERGPIRELLHQIDGGVTRFDEIHILHCVKEEQDRSALHSFEERLRRDFPSRRERIEFHAVDLASPIDHASITAETRRVLDELEQANQNRVNWHFHLSPGTPAMATVLAVLGRTLYPAILYQTSREGRFVDEARIPHDMGSDIFRKLFTASRGSDRFDAFQKIHHDGDPMATIIRDAVTVARHPSFAVTILGETGTGKELFAEAIHRASPLHDKPFIVFNAAAIPSTIAESELFGHEKGAFTGAVQRRDGLVTQADGGTLFLDEFADLPMDVQAKLLRFLNDGRYRPVGSSGKERTASCRIVVATNGDPYSLIRKERLRADLYHRVNGFVIKLPPLRARGKDVIVIADALTRELNERLRADDPAWQDRHLARDAKKYLQQYEWPGNVRELRNTLKRAFVFSSAVEVSSADLERSVDRRPDDPESLLPELVPGRQIALKDTKNRIERHYKQWALRLCDGNGARAAKMLTLTKLNPDGKPPKKGGAKVRK